jgi:serine/threonine protein kinase
MTSIEEQALKIGTQIAVYEIKEILGSNQSEIIYRAWNTHLNTLVVLKEFFPSEYASRDAMDQSVSANSTQNTPVFEFGLGNFIQQNEKLLEIQAPGAQIAHNVLEFNQTAYLAVEEGKGSLLSKYLDNAETYTEEELKNLLESLLETLETFHDAGVVHGDIHPSNILIKTNGKPELLNFASARQNFARHVNNLSSELSEGYASPEQYIEGSKAEVSTDLYALGATLYQCVSGEVPVDSRKRALDLSEQKPDPLKSILAQKESGFSGEFLVTVDWLLQVDSKARPQSVGEIFSAENKDKSSFKYIAASGASDSADMPIDQAHFPISKGRRFGAATLAAGMLASGALGSVATWYLLKKGTSEDSIITTEVAREGAAFGRAIDRTPGGADEKIEVSLVEGEGGAGVADTEPSADKVASIVAAIQDMNTPEASMENQEPGADLQSNNQLDHEGVAAEKGGGAEFRQIEPEIQDVQVVDESAVDIEAEAAAVVEFPQTSGKPVELSIKDQPGLDKPESNEGRGLGEQNNMNQSEKIKEEQQNTVLAHSGRDVQPVGSVSETEAEAEAVKSAVPTSGPVIEEQSAATKGRDALNTSVETSMTQSKQESKADISDEQDQASTTESAPDSSAETPDVSNVSIETSKAQPGQENKADISDGQDQASTTESAPDSSAETPDVSNVSIETSKAQPEQENKADISDGQDQVSSTESAPDSSAENPGASNVSIAQSEEENGTDASAGQVQASRTESTPSFSAEDTPIAQPEQESKVDVSGGEAQASSTESILDSSLPVEAENEDEVATNLEGGSLPVSKASPSFDAPHEQLNTEKTDVNMTTEEVSAIEALEKDSMEGGSLDEAPGLASFESPASLPEQTIETNSSDGRSGSMESLPENQMSEGKIKGKEGGNDSEVPNAQGNSVNGIKNKEGIRNQQASETEVASQENDPTMIDANEQGLVEAEVPTPSAVSVIPQNNDIVPTAEPTLGVELSSENAGSSESAIALATTPGGGEKNVDIFISNYEKEQKKTEGERSLIEQYMAKANENFAALRLTTPADNNAYYYYKLVLEIDPQHEGAQKGTEQIFDRYMALINRAIEKNEPNIAKAYLKRAKAISPDSPALEEVVSNLDKLLAPKPGG